MQYQHFHCLSSGAKRSNLSFLYLMPYENNPESLLEISEQDRQFQVAVQVLFLIFEMDGIWQLLAKSVQSESVNIHRPSRPRALLTTENVQLTWPQKEVIGKNQKIAYRAPIKPVILSAKSHCPYSSWQDSHLSPKISKQLQENLTGLHSEDNYSLWEDSHLSPEISKQIEENLTIGLHSQENYSWWQDIHLSPEISKQLEENQTGKLEEFGATFVGKIEEFGATFIGKIQELECRFDKLKETYLRIMPGVQQLVKAVEETQNLQQALNQSQEQQNLLKAELQVGTEKLKDANIQIKFLEREISQLQKQNGSMAEQISSGSMSIRNLEEEISIMKRAKVDLLNVVAFHVDQKNALQQELYCLRDNQKLRELCRKNQSQEQQNLLAAELQVGTEKLKDANRQITFLEREISQLQKQNINMAEQISSGSMSVRNLEEEISMMKQEKVDLLNVVAFHVDQKNALQQELDCLRDKQKLREWRKNNDMLSFYIWEVLRLEDDMKNLQLLNKNLQEEKLMLTAEIEQQKNQRNILETHLHDFQKMNSQLESLISSCIICKLRKKKKSKKLQHFIVK